MEAYAACNSEVVTLDTDMQTCIERAEADGRPDGTVDAIRKWFESREKGYEVDVKTKTVEVKADENGRITGYAATFIREPDSYGDVIAKGAFAESIEAIKADNRVLPLLWNHEGGDLDAYIGTVDELSEDEHGLLFSASFDATEKAQRARELSADGRLAKFSFAYTVLDEGEVELEDGRKANELRKLDIHEVSLVLYPANPDTSIVDVKDAPNDSTIHDDLNLIAKAIEEFKEIKAGRRNSAKDEGDLERIAELAGSIQSIVNGLLGEETPAPDEQQEESEVDEEEAKSEELDTANDEEPTQKAAEVDELLEKARKLLKERD